MMNHHVCCKPSIERNCCQYQLLILLDEDLSLCGLYAWIDDNIMLSIVCRAWMVCVCIAVDII